MSNYVDPEWLPAVPKDDRGTFYCYIFWLKETRQYYVGHSGKIDDGIRRHFRSGVKTTRGFTKKLLWVSREMRFRTDARNFEAALKHYIKSGNEAEFIYQERAMPLLPVG